MIYVTHDQIEALTLADRIAIMRSGIIQQLDAPQTIYELEHLGVPFSRACLTDLLEGEGGELPVSDDAVEIAYRPWQIITIAVRS